mmetsp:Transcript_76652/g.221569  ORF Transcript_76652/g.221569 Transcript_76652/m.221569 type:complete len:208 (-) Transcript_76652:102-725(-)
MVCQHPPSPVACFASVGTAHGQEQRRAHNRRLERQQVWILCPGDRNYRHPRHERAQGDDPRDRQPRRHVQQVASGNHDDTHHLQRLGLGIARRPHLAWVVAKQNCRMPTTAPRRQDPKGARCYNAEPFPTDGGRTHGEFDDDHRHADESLHDGDSNLEHEALPLQESCGRHGVSASTFHRCVHDQDGGFGNDVGSMQGDSPKGNSGL